MQVLDTSASLAEIGRRVRARVIRMSHEADTPHLGSALSCVDLLVSVYWHAARCSPDRLDELERDRVILSKGHAAPAQYVCLALKGFFPESDLYTFNTAGSKLTEHPSRHCVPGIEASTGSLGHGLSLGAGLALGMRILTLSARVFVILSDGECQEGTTWEAAMFASNQRLNNLIALVDCNTWQATSRTAEVMGQGTLVERWRAFGWNVIECDGHNYAELSAGLDVATAHVGSPTILVANTVKGRGVSFMEDDNNWHYRIPSEQELALALKELNAQ